MARYSGASWRATRPCRSAGTSLWSAGASSSPCSGHGATTKSRCRSIRPAAPDPGTGRRPGIQEPDLAGRAARPRSGVGLPDLLARPPALGPPEGDLADHLAEPLLTKSAGPNPVMYLMVSMALEECSSAPAT